MWIYLKNIEDLADLADYLVDDEIELEFLSFWKWTIVFWTLASDIGGEPIKQSTTKRLLILSDFEANKKN